MTSQLKEEIYDLFNRVAPLIIFFGLPVELQLKALPVLEEQTLYDFPEGDLLANHALHVLIAHYHTYLNSILIRVSIVLDEEIDEDLDSLVQIMVDILDETDKISDLFYEDNSTVESLDSSEWDTIRPLSQVLGEKLQIDLEVNKKLMSSFLELRIHP